MGPGIPRSPTRAPTRGGTEVMPDEKTTSASPSAASIASTSRSRSTSARLRYKSSPTAGDDSSGLDFDEARSSIFTMAAGGSGAVASDGMTVYDGAATIQGKDGRRLHPWRAVYPRPGFPSSPPSTLFPLVRVFLRDGKLLTLTLGHLTVDSYAGVIPVLYPILIGRFRLSLATVGLVSLAYSGMAAVSQPLFGVLADRFGTRFTGFALCWTALTFSLVGFVTSFPLLLLLAFSS